MALKSIFDKLGVMIVVGGISVTACGKETQVNPDKSVSITDSSGTNTPALVFKTKGTNYSVTGFTDEEIVPGVRRYNKSGVEIVKIYLPKIKMGPVVLGTKAQTDSNKKQRTALKLGSITDFYNQAKNNNYGTPIVTFNTVFFDNLVSGPCSNCYSLLSDYFRTNGVDVEGGGVLSEYYAFMVNNDNSIADIQKFKNAKLSDFKHIIAGDRGLIDGGQKIKDYKFNVREKDSTGRTALAVKDEDGDGKNEAVYVLVTNKMTVANVTDTLMLFGVKKAMLFDGSGSSKLMINNVVKMAGDSRIIPLAFFATKK